MKKLLAVILAIVMMFSMTSVSFANETAETGETVATIDNYVDYLEDKLEDTETNIFVKMLVKIVLVFIHFGFIKPEDFEDWFANTASDKDEIPTDSDETKPEDKPATDWEDGTELTHNNTQSLPYAQNGVTITDIKITKEHYNGIREETLQMYKYVITAEGFFDNYDNENPHYYEIDITYLSDFSNETRYYVTWPSSERNIESTITIDDAGNFVYYCEQYMIYNDYDSFFINKIDRAAI